MIDFLSKTSLLILCKIAGDVVGPFEKRQTRCKFVLTDLKLISYISCLLLGDELKHTVSIVVGIATALDPDGVDIYFLNRQPIYNVTKIDQIAHVFAAPPAGNDEKNVFL